LLETCTPSFDCVTSKELLTSDDASRDPAEKFPRAPSRGSSLNNSTGSGNNYVDGAARSLIQTFSAADASRGELCGEKMNGKERENRRCGRMTASNSNNYVETAARDFATADASTRESPAGEDRRNADERGTDESGQQRCGRLSFGQVMEERKRKTTRRHRMVSASTQTPSAVDEFASPDRADPGTLDRTDPVTADWTDPGASVREDYDRAAMRTFDEDSDVRRVQNKTGMHIHWCLSTSFQLLARISSSSSNFL